ncbi:transposase [Flavobacterium tegetincola]|uniref:transposase n=1 Tax=Flavobacterium tegetincola TaxID=150172 RepID=UPI000408BEDA|nr:transposase [Flavobacterium tegetincola]
MSSLNTWAPRERAHQRIVHPENIGIHLSCDEVTLSQGKLYTIVTNKKFKGKKDCLVAIVAETKAEHDIEHICRINYEKRGSDQEIILNMANYIKLISKKCFPKTIQVTDKFRVQKLALEALQENRIKHRWEAMNIENRLIMQAKRENRTYIPELLSNKCGITTKNETNILRPLYY